MNKNIYSVYDRKTKLYSTPFYVINDDSAIRDFYRAINDPAHEASHYASDLTLYCLGSWDDQTGLLTAQQPDFVTDANQFIAE